MIPHSNVRIDLGCRIGFPGLCEFVEHFRFGGLFAGDTEGFGGANGVGDGLFDERVEGGLFELEEHGLDFRVRRANVSTGEGVLRLYPLRVGSEDGSMVDFRGNVFGKGMLVTS